MTTQNTSSQNYEERELAASLEVKSILAALRNAAAAQEWTFEVGYTTAMDYTLEQLAGLRPPDNWLELAKQQNRLARAAAEGKTVTLEKCVATATQFNWADYDAVTGVRPTQLRQLLGLWHPRSFREQLCHTEQDKDR